MNTFWDVFWERREELLKLFVEHMEMTSTAVLVSLIVGVIIGIAITKNKTAASIVIGIANLMQSIPSIGLLAFMVPFVGIGQKPAIIMIVIYALLPIIKNTYTGITGIDPKLLEAARGTLPKSAPIPALTPVSTANPTTLPPVTSVVPSAISHTSYSVKPKSIDFTGFDVFYLPLKQSR